MVERESGIGRKTFIGSMVRHAPWESAKIAASLLVGKHRDVLAESRVIASLEGTEIIGSENIPERKVPFIIASNHPPLKDLFVAVAHINLEFEKLRGESKDDEQILWLVAKNLHPRRKGKIGVVDTIKLNSANVVLRGVHRSYDFLPVPINYDSPQNLRHERARVILQARDHLQNLNGSMAVGIFPEGAFEDETDPYDFLNGVGMLVKAVREPVCVIPTSISRQERGGLVVEFMQPLSFNKNDSRDVITTQIEDAIRHNTSYYRIIEDL